MSVVKETRQIFSVADIKAIRLKCNVKDCKAESGGKPRFSLRRSVSAVWPGMA